MELRPATTEDAAILLEWRNDSLTRQQSVHTAPVGWEEHVSWLEKSLANPDRQIYIAMEGNRPVGTLRVDQHPDGTAEFSWTIAPSERGQGYGRQMVQMGVEMFPTKRVIARIKSGNKPSIRIAERLGFKCCGETDDLILWEMILSQ